MQTFSQADLNKLKKGDHQSFERIFTEFYDRVLYFIRNYVSDHESARELVQDVFAKLWEKRQSLAENTNIQALLFTMARNAALNFIDHVLARRRYIEYNQKKAFEMQLNSYALRHETVEQIYAKETQTRIENAIISLPPKCREIFELSRYEEMSYKAIAEKLNISVKTVENQIALALRKIRDQMKDDVQSPL